MQTQTSSFFLILTEIQTCNERFYVRADTKEGTQEWIRTLRKAAVSISLTELAFRIRLNLSVFLQSSD